MNSDLIKQLTTKYPSIFQSLYSIECDDGWFNILDVACSCIQTGVELLPEEFRSELYAVQIKEKFGSLVIHMNHTTPYISGIIAMARSISTKTCEKCELPGKLRPSSWVRTLCDLHYEDHNNIMKLAFEKAAANQT